MPKTSPANAWVGAPPVSEGAFAFAHGDFFAEASGQNRHRRATPQELKTHFTSGNDKDHPAHWFEAQLIHYGLQPSKTKSGKLKKEWTKNDREAKKVSKASTSTPAKVAGAKRKADDDAGPSKKAKTTTTKVTTTTKATTTKASASKASASKASTSKASAAKAPSATPAKKQTARRGGISQGPTRASRQDSPESPPRKKQTARRSNAFMARGRIEAPSPRPTGYDFAAPPPYSEYPDDGGYRSDDYPSHGGYQSHSDNYDNDGYDDGYDDEVSLAPLGLLNGDYEIDSEYVTSQWDYPPDDLGLTLTLSGSSLWGRFNLGVYEGVFFIEDRPMRSSHEKVWFKWRGREDQGPIIYGDRNNGWIKFLGDGRIEGFLDMQSLSFQGRRFPDQPTRSSIDARSMKNEFDGYSEDEYDRENRARW
ncbi:uncharacterized protein NECHADRAFT_47452 [Fusarium vanettenii 77-13-4]|uniref:Uncharacterized protein n=1 Tax=Fusarium vanettenii (strain ATCC MYA-4622 / CBS 123669 / FGSC 9596 / NRRL 45880 / 77-13-4) TaxID=660122 RepID=C7Z011_FUSV7|nr:uncharacterized protein NECHADRAFT_47452 [Fusarium vanettenii 77-13-4]EEU42707.1 hypothetical protein NECHADRAFT_47452 [Fusarium vanettenii 77-13-4]